MFNYSTGQVIDEPITLKMENYEINFALESVTVNMGGSLSVISQLIYNSSNLMSNNKIQHIEKRHLEGSPNVSKKGKRTVFLDSFISDANDLKKQITKTLRDDEFMDELNDAVINTFNEITKNGDERLIQLTYTSATPIGYDLRDSKKKDLYQITLDFGVTRKSPDTAIVSLKSMYPKRK